MPSISQPSSAFANPSAVYSDVTSSGRSPRASSDSAVSWPIAHSFEACSARASPPVSSSIRKKMSTAFAEAKITRAVRFRRAMALRTRSSVGIGLISMVGISMTAAPRSTSSRRNGIDLVTRARDQDAPPVQRSPGQRVEALRHVHAGAEDQQRIAAQAIGRGLAGQLAKRGARRGAAPAGRG